jgi:hypothetical protein
LPEWLYEAGIGENRAVLIDKGTIVEAHIERHDRAVRAGAIVDARLVEILRPARRGIAVLSDGNEVIVEPLPPEWCEGGTARIAIVRDALPERGAVKRAKGRPAPDSGLAEAPALRDRLARTGIPVRDVSAVAVDALEDAGWTELIERAQSGIWPFEGGTLRIEPTAAMTVIDVDGYLAPEPLARAAATAAAAAIRCLDITGSIAIDFPTLGGKSERQRVADAFDAALPPPFERTAINGFGLMQVIRPRVRASLIEHLRHDAAGHAARALLRTAERSGSIGAMSLVAPPRVIAVYQAHPEWTDALARRLGGRVALRADPALAMSGSYVERA